MFRVKSISLALACLFPLTATAATVTIASPEHNASVTLIKNGAWGEFRFDKPEDEEGVWLEPVTLPWDVPEGTMLGTVSFHFMVPEEEKATLRITDAYRWGDRFSVYANGIHLGETDNASEDPNPSKENDYFNDFDLAFENPNWSSGEWHFGAGKYTITGYVIDQPEIRGRGGARLIDFSGTDGDEVFMTPVPLPGALSFLLTGCAATAVVSRRRRRRKEVA